MENQRSIVDWQFTTFGPVSPKEAFLRMQKEYWELRELVYPLSEAPVSEDKCAAAREECADVFITLCRVMQVLGGDMQTEVDKKMAVNRTRKWENGQHK